MTNLLSPAGRWTKAKKKNSQANSNLKIHKALTKHKKYLNTHSRRTGMVRNWREIKQRQEVGGRSQSAWPPKMCWCAELITVCTRHKYTHSNVSTKWTFCYVEQTAHDMIRCGKLHLTPQQKAVIHLFRLGFTTPNTLQECSDGKKTKWKLAKTSEKKVWYCKGNEPNIRFQFFDTLKDSNQRFFFLTFSLLFSCLTLSFHFC